MSPVSIHVIVLWILLMQSVGIGVRYAFYAHTFLVLVPSMISLTTLPRHLRFCMITHTVNASTAFNIYGIWLLCNSFIQLQRLTLYDALVIFNQSLIVIFSYHAVLQRISMLITSPHYSLLISSLLHRLLHCLFGLRVFLHISMFGIQPECTPSTLLWMVLPMKLATARPLLITISLLPIIPVTFIIVRLLRRNWQDRFLSIFTTPFYIFLVVLLPISMERTSTINNLAKENKDWAFGQTQALLVISGQLVLALRTINSLWTIRREHKDKDVAPHSLSEYSFEVVRTPDQTIHLRTKFSEAEHERTPAWHFY